MYEDLRKWTEDDRTVRKRASREFIAISWVKKFLPLHIPVFPARSKSVFRPVSVFILPNLVGRIMFSVVSREIYSTSESVSLSLDSLA